jgi:transcriptional regulator with AAA-type ATPase domain
MVKVNCAALPSTLVESELFGREKGAYTGAVSREPGRFEVANGSTLFLDEVAELPLELQAKLLRVLEEGQFERVGSSRTLRTDVRVIAATNRDLKAEVEAGRFRRDLFFRLAVFPIRVPPLRERRGDVPLLVWSAVEEFSTQMNRSIENIRRQDLERLQHYDWPGNVRELRNVVERAMILSSGTVLRVEPPAAPVPADNHSAVMSLDEAQRREIAKALEASGGRISGRGCGRAAGRQADHPAFEDAAAGIDRARPEDPLVIVTTFRHVRWQGFRLKPSRLETKQLSERDLRHNPGRAARVARIVRNRGWTLGKVRMSGCPTSSQGESDPSAPAGGMQPMRGGQR